MYAAKPPKMLTNVTSDRLTRNSRLMTPTMIFIMVVPKPILYRCQLNVQVYDKPSQQISCKSTYNNKRRIPSSITYVTLLIRKHKRPNENLQI